MQDCIQFQSQPSHHHASLWCLIPASISTANQSTKPSIHSVLKFCWESIYLYIIAIWYIYNRRAQVKQLASIFCQKKKKKKLACGHQTDYQNLCIGQTFKATRIHKENKFTTTVRCTASQSGRQPRLKALTLEQFYEFGHVS